MRVCILVLALMCEVVIDDVYDDSSEAEEEDDNDVLHFSSDEVS